MSHIGFRTMANASIGLGHLKRCLALASTFSGKTHFYLCEADSQAEKVLNRSGQSHSVIPIGEFTPDTGELKGKLDVCIFDLTNPYGIGNGEKVAKEARRVRDSDALAVLIDGLADIVIVTNADFPIDVLIKPYAGAEMIKDAPFRQLCGPEWAIFPKGLTDRVRSLSAGRKHDTPSIARKILVTCGGADPTNITLLALDALLAAKIDKAEIMVIAGPLFSDALNGEIEARIAPLEQYEIIDAPDSIIEYISWCDFAIASSGLTKYELALMGKPSIQLSLDADNAVANAGFAELGCSLHLGPSSAVTVQQLTAAITTMAADKSQRDDMINKCISAIDGRGTQRIVNQLKELISAR